MSKLLILFIYIGCISTASSQDISILKNGRLVSNPNTCIVYIVNGDTILLNTHNVDVKNNSHRLTDAEIVVLYENYVIPVGKNIFGNMISISLETRPFIGFSKYRKPFTFSLKKFINPVFAILDGDDIVLGYLKKRKNKHRNLISKCQ